MNRKRAFAIEVQDAGPGVPPEFESRLFERFAQADGSATREKGGTGSGFGGHAGDRRESTAALSATARPILLLVERIGATFSL